jgi:hypothetical protein
MRRFLFALAIALAGGVGAVAAVAAASAAGASVASASATGASAADGSAADGSAVSGAASGDPLQAPECQQALAALRDEEAAAASGPSAARGGRRDAHAVAPGLDAARRRAAHSCLASRADPPPFGRLAQPPVAVPPVTGIRPPLPALPPASSAVAIPTRPPSPQPLTSITACDASGCWASDGTRLNRVGPTLWGPHGACSVFGAVVRCP